MLAGSAIAATLRWWRPVDGASWQHRTFWAGMTLGLAYLAIDEIVGFHEMLGDRNASVHTTGERVFGVFRSWNDILVILYGLFAVVGWMFFAHVLRSMPGTLALLVVAFACYAVHTLIDSVVEPANNVSIILEESAKAFCGLFLLLSCTLRGRGEGFSEGR
jgi:hypothetical protein